MQSLALKVEQAANHIRDAYSKTPKVGLILGTGLGGVAEQIEAHAAIPYASIPNFPHSTVESHSGQLICGTLAGHETIAMEGRVHYYEGYSMEEITLPVRVMRALGCELLVVTNAAGAMNPQYSLADIMIIEDHINLHYENPLRGPNDESLGLRFPDMSAPYTLEYVKKAREAALELAIPHHSGVLVSVPGPNLETRAEYRMLRGFGADSVTMSTIPEVIVAVHAGMRVLGFSIVTDLCLPDALEPVELPKIIATAQEGGQHLAKLIPQVLTKIEL